MISLKYIKKKCILILKDELKVLKKYKALKSMEVLMNGRIFKVDNAINKKSFYQKFSI